MRWQCWLTIDRAFYQTKRATSMLWSTHGDLATLLATLLADEESNA